MLIVTTTNLESEAQEALEEMLLELETQAA